MTKFGLPKTSMRTCITTLSPHHLFPVGVDNMLADDRAHWAGDSDSNFGLPSPPAMGGDDPSYFSSSQLPNDTGDGEEAFVPSKMGYLHIKNQAWQE